MSRATEELRERIEELERQADETVESDISARRRIHELTGERDDAQARLTYLERYAVIQVYERCAESPDGCKLAPLFDAQDQHPDDADLCEVIDAVRARESKEQGDA